MLNGRETQSLPDMDVAGRLPRLEARLRETGCDGLLVTKLVNVRYLTGFSGSAAMLLVLPEESVLLTDERYKDQSLEQVKASGAPVRIEIGRAHAQTAVIESTARSLQRLGLEADNVTWGTQQHLEQVLGRLVKLVPVSKAVESLRRVKDEGELARIERAADVADVALAQVKERLREAPTEREFAVELELEMRRRGADAIAFDSIVASGPNAALPHASPTDRRIEPGELVVLDFGAMVDGYRSDMTRTLCVGEARSEEMRQLLEAVLAAQRAGVRAVRAGVKGAEVDAACRDSLESAGLREVFSHGTGHGVGLEVHEAPAVAHDSADILEEGAVVTVEPGAYLYPTGGARIEDTLVVTAGGSRLLTKSTKDYVL